MPTQSIDSLTLEDVDALTLDALDQLVLNEGYEGVQSSKLLFKNRLFAGRLFAASLWRGAGEAGEVTFAKPCGPASITAVRSAMSITTLRSVASVGPRQIASKGLCND